MHRPPSDTDVVVVGAGIVGLAAARALQHRRPGRRVVIIDKEPTVAAHQTGHNSGVVHSGLYYRPGSLKATLVAAGRTELIDYCRARGLHLDVCGKVVVATHDDEVGRLRDLERRAVANGVGSTLLDPVGLRRIEPHATGVAALHVPSAAIVDFGEIARSLASDVGKDDSGSEVVLGCGVRGIRPDGTGVVVETDGGEIRARTAVNCAGLHSDLLAQASGLDPQARIVAFRGEYHELVPARRHLVRHLIYPVPDPRFPFLGVHLTRMTDGSVHAGPNAVLAMAREGYGWRRVDVGEMVGLARSPAMRSLARRHWRTGAGEVGRSLSRRAMVTALRDLVPDLRPVDLVRAGAGVRAQALGPDGTLLDDFVIERDGPVVHVVNAPSPAATASFAIGRYIAALVDDEQPTIGP
ncbi:MAG: L-2-hydroxyglutarate oxidase [Acidimicrobiales bacterium]